MKSRKLTLFGFILALVCGFNQASAQFNLDSQRKEKSSSGIIPGEKLNHDGIFINPTPQVLSVVKGKFLDYSKGFKIKSDGQIDQLTEDAKTVGIPLSNNGIPLVLKIASKKYADKFEGAYDLKIGGKSVEITASDDAGLFYGLQTLSQIIDSPASSNGKMPQLTITDYPHIKTRGLVEGFYGNPWSHQTRLSLIDYLGKNKMNTYIYGPKDDPYHSSPNWRLPYPEDKAKEIEELVARSDKNHVNFVWAIHPGQDIQWNEEDYKNLLNKFNMMYDHGVRSFAVFFDDIEGSGTDSRQQAMLLNNLTRDFVNVKGDVSELMVCPTDYSQLWANPSEKGQLAIYGNELLPGIDVFWTGEYVCSDLTPETLEFIDSRIKRPALYWWNFPVTDYAREIIMQGPTYGLDPTIGPNELSGIVSNPMEHGEASKLALFGVGDYAWNPAAYNPMDNWERGIEDIAPEVAEAYRTFAIHNGDTKKGYRRDESWETETFKFNDYTPEQFENLKAEFEKIKNVPAAMQKMENKNLLAELQPWLTAFGKMGERGLTTMELIKLNESGNDSLFLETYISNLMTPEERAAYQQHKTGVRKLEPFYTQTMSDLFNDYSNRKRASGDSIPAIVNLLNNLSAETNIPYVDPKIGSGGHGHVFVGASVPFGMVQAGPTSLPQEWDWVSGYHDSDSTVIGFSQTHLSGTGIGDLFDITIMPVTGDVTYARGKAGEPESGLWSYADRSKEVTMPGYYSVPLERYDILAEVTATNRTGDYRFTFPESDSPAIVIDLQNGGCWDRPTEVSMVAEGNRRIKGYRKSKGWADKQDVYFVAEFSEPFTDFTLHGQDNMYGRVSFPATSKDHPITVKVGISPNSINAASSNLAAEAQDLNFEEIAANALKAWNQEISKIEVNSDNIDELKKFYTSMYHLAIHPSAFNDYGKPADYTILSLWDTYRTQMPLFTILDPQLTAEIVNAMLDIHDKQGRLPVWHLWGSETDCMVGNPGIIVVADAVVKDIPGIDKERALKAMIETAENPGRGGDIRKEYGYIPIDLMKEAISWDMEYAIADAAIANAARAMGKNDIADEYEQKSHSYRNYFDKKTGFMRGKDSKGQWRKPFNPSYSVIGGDYCEGNAWQYSWLVPHDLEGLKQLHGGKDKMLKKLDQLFEASSELLGDNVTPDISGMIGQYVQGNEPSHHIIYFYSMEGDREKTAELSEKILEEQYTILPDGLSGNEDCGQMSAWYIMSSLGFYPVEPAGARYWFGTPHYQKATVNLPENRKFTVIKGEKGQEPTLNGKLLGRNYITHDEIMSGGTLILP